MTLSRTSYNIADTENFYENNDDDEDDDDGPDADEQRARTNTDATPSRIKDWLKSRRRANKSLMKRKHLRRPTPDTARSIWAANGQNFSKLLVHTLRPISWLCKTLALPHIIYTPNRVSSPLPFNFSYFSLTHLFVVCTPKSVPFFVEFTSFLFISFHFIFSRLLPRSRAV